MSKMKQKLERKTREAMRRGDKRALADVLEKTFRACPFRTLLGHGITSIEEALKRPGCVLALLGCKPEPLTDEDWARVDEVLSAGKTLLLMADRKDVRDNAKQQIALRYGFVAGAA